MPATHRRVGTRSACRSRRRRGRRAGPRRAGTGCPSAVRSDRPGTPARAAGRPAGRSGRPPRRRCRCTGAGCTGGVRTPGTGRRPSRRTPRVPAASSRDSGRDSTATRTAPTGRTVRTWASPGTHRCRDSRRRCPTATPTGRHGARRPCHSGRDAGHRPSGRGTAGSRPTRTAPRRGRPRRSPRASSRRLSRCRGTGRGCASTPPSARCRRRRPRARTPRSRS